MRHVVGFTTKITESPFYIAEMDGEVAQFSVGQLVKIEPSSTEWLQIYQIGTQVFQDRIYTTIFVGAIQPAGTLNSSDAIWADAPYWTASRQ